MSINSTNRVILALVNQERRKRRANPVIFDESLHRHAMNWSKHMAHEKRLSHSGTILENCAMVSSHGSPITITKKMFFIWKGSHEHWAWMMNPGISRAAFAFSERANYAYGAYAFR